MTTSSALLIVTIVCYISCTTNSSQGCTSYDDDGIHIDDYIDRAHARSTTIENGYLPCARAWSSQCGIHIALPIIIGSEFRSLAIFDTFRSEISRILLLGSYQYTFLINVVCWLITRNIDYHSSVIFRPHGRRTS